MFYYAPLEDGPRIANTISIKEKAREYRAYKYSLRFERGRLPVVKLCGL
jgi:hypothetical protein